MLRVAGRSDVGMDKEDLVIEDIWGLTTPEGVIEEKAEKYKKLSDEQLLKKFRETESAEDVDWDELVALRYVLADRFGFVSIDILEVFQVRFAEKIAEELNEVIHDLKHHRHELNKNFSSKPEF